MPHTGGLGVSGRSVWTVHGALGSKPNQRLAAEEGGWGPGSSECQACFKSAGNYETETDVGKLNSETERHAKMID